MHNINALFTQMQFQLTADTTPFERVFHMHGQGDMNGANALQLRHQLATRADDNRFAPSGDNGLCHLNGATLYPA